MTKMIKKILIVDDSKVARMMIKNSIPGDQGYEIVIAEDGKQGLEKFKDFKPDVTFMDLTMPVLDGYKATEAILDYDKSAIIIALTADIQAKSVERITEIGAYTFIKKPARGDIIKKTLSEVNAKLENMAGETLVDAADILSDEEKDLLQEIMNIGFGNATADLAEIIDIYVELSIPNIQLINVGGLHDYIKETIYSFDETSMVGQKFWGDFSGSGLLVLPSRAGRELISMLEEDDADVVSDKPMAILEKESLVEVGNILIGACVGKISELLKTFATYSPPQIISEFIDDYDSFVKSFDEFQTAIVLKTLFKFEKKDLSGLLLLLTSQESIVWLRKALKEFLESYE